MQIHSYTSTLSNRDNYKQYKNKNAYATPILRKDEMSVLTLRDTSGLIDCGCRFKYIPNEVLFDQFALDSAGADSEF